MHPLTYEILRELRGAAVHELEDQYLHFLLGKAVVLPAASSPVGDRLAWYFGRELVNGTDVMDGWKYLQPIDGATWMAVRTERTAEADATYMARYEFLPSGLFKVDYRTATRSPLKRDEAMQFQHAMDVYLWRAGQTAWIYYRPLDELDEDFIRMMDSEVERTIPEDVYQRVWAARNASRITAPKVP